MPPTMPGYIHADVPHEKTSIGRDYRYGCNGLPPRNTPTKMWVQDGWTEDGRRKMIKIDVTHGDVICGHDARKSDPACAGCPNRHWTPMDA